MKSGIQTALKQRPYGPESENKREIGIGVGATDGLRHVDLRYIYSTYSLITYDILYLIVERELPRPQSHLLSNGNESF